MSDRLFGRLLPALILPVVLAVGCEPPRMVRDLLDELPEADADYGLATIEVTDVRRIPLEAHYPTDLTLLPDGGFAVLDGYSNRLLMFGPDAQPRGVLQGEPGWGRPVRAVALDRGGFWLADPGDEEIQGALLRIDAKGAVTHVVALPEPESLRPGSSSPVALAMSGEALLIGDRSGRILLIDPASGETKATFTEGADGAEFAAIVDFATLPDGGHLAVDTLGPRVHRLEATGEPASWIGHFGPWAGYLRKPKSAVPLEDGSTLLVVDSSFDSVQLFSAEGRGFGVLATGGTPLEVDHGVAARMLPDGQIAILSAATPEVVLLRVAGEAVDQAREAALRRRLRTPISKSGDSTSEHTAESCFQCHDGFVNDDRANWDEDLDHHPVDVVPEKDIPAFFPLDDAGRMTCTTCHSAHGWVSKADAEGVEKEEEIQNLVRHRDEGAAFLRVPIEQSGLCASCHGDAAHTEFLTSLGMQEGGHPVGAELEKLLAKREGDDVTRADCLGCHSPHAATGDKLLRSEEEGGFCLGCHSDHADAADDHPLGRRVGKDVPTPSKASRLVLARDGGTTCATCHDFLAGRGEALLRARADGGQLCLACHDSRKELKRAPHGRLRGAHGLPCLSCHDVHGGASKDRFLITVRSASAEDPQGCLDCHGKGRSAHKGRNLPGKLGHPISGGEGDNKLEGCATCHDAHLAGHVSGPPCTDCHDEQAAEQKRGGHGSARCPDCHPPHRAAPVGTAAADVNPSALSCLACHGEDTSTKLGPNVDTWEHPEPVFLPDGQRWAPLGKLPLFGADGEPVAAGKNGDLTCRSCHRVHGPDPDKPGENLRRPDWQEACAACHGDEALTLYRWFHDAGRRHRDEAGEKP